eukprot:TRINITY_DN124_c0_g1_i6.p1 TRINITY_DN124_c0_g1~~TRINITY_DN124_c0_g1_i6.p1  ORF type:complete len:367 (+),score=80.76 TRINITY_DN124_c0_g1_i6:33-1133(+)
MNHNPIREWLLETKVAAIPVPVSGSVAIKTAAASDPVAKTLDSLRTNKLLSLPVLDSDGSCIGFVDMVDMVAKTADLMEAKGAWGSYYSALQSEAAFKNLTTKEVMNISERDPLFSVTMNTDLRRLARLMGPDCLHRVLIREGEDIDSERTTRAPIKGVITQSALVKFLGSRIESLSLIADKSLEELGVGTRYSLSLSLSLFLISLLAGYRSLTLLNCSITYVHMHVGTSDVISVNVVASLIQCFRYMKATGVSAVPVVNDSEHLCGVISVRDMRAMVEGTYSTYISFDALNKKCGDFVESRGKFFQDKPWNVHQSVTCTPDTTFAQAIEIIRESSCHHIFMVDENHKVIKCIGLCDLVQVLHQQH